MNFINTKHYDKKRKVLYDQDGYPTNDLINKVEQDQAEDDYVLLDDKIRDDCTALATSISTTVATSIATSTVNTKLNTSPLDLVSSSNEFIRITGSAASTGPSNAVTIETKQTAAGDSTAHLYLKASGWGETTIGREYNGANVTFNGNYLTTTNSASGFEDLYIQSKGGSSSVILKSQAGGNLAWKGSTNTLSAPTTDLIITAPTSTKIVSIPTYYSFGGSGYYYAELPAGANAFSATTITSFNWNTSVTNTFGGSRAYWTNGTGFENRTGYTLTLFVEVFAISTHTNDTTDFESWFTIGGVDTVRYARTNQHNHTAASQGGAFSTVLSIPNNSYFQWKMYSNKAGTFWGSNNNGGEGLEIGNNRAYMRISQIA
jgi:hypothetical protein